MGIFRFRKTISIMPGVRLNISKTGVSTSVGPRGATVNIGERGTRATVGLPGSGVSYSQKISKRGSSSGAAIVFALLAAVAWFFLH